MSTILLLETATKACSVAIQKDGELKSLREDISGKYSHSEKITIFIDEVMKESKMSFSELDAVAVSMGPGSYTGLRIGVSTSKGICYAAEKPLIAVDTLHAMALGLLNSKNQEICENDLLCPMIDARRMEVFCAFFNSKGEKITKTEAAIVDENSFSEYFQNRHIWFFGDGAEKFTETFKNQSNAIICKNFNLSAAYMIPLAENAVQNNDFVDVAYFEPFYLKDFVVGIPKVKGLK